MVSAIAATVGCTPKKPRRKSSSEGGESGDGIPDKIWETGFKGCIRIAGEGRCEAEPAYNEVDPAGTENKQLFAIMTTKVNKISVVGQKGEYDMDLSYTYTVENSTSSAEDFFEYTIENPDSGKNVVFFKNFPAVGTELSACPVVHVTAKGVIEGKERTKTYLLRFHGYNSSFDVMTIPTIYETNPKCFKWMTEDFTTQGHETACEGAFGPDITKYDSWWQNQETKFVHASIETYGYITYMSPDLNNGILECGGQALQLYQVVKYAGWDWTKDDVMNKPVRVRGELSGGFGNIQLSYIREIFPVSNDISVAAPTTPTEFTEEMISNIKWSENPIFNKIVKATTVKFNGNVRSIKNNSAGAATDVSDPITGSALDQVDFTTTRYEFDVLIGSTVLTVQTDYHIIERYPELAASLKAIVKKAEGAEVKIGGTIRWLNDRSVVGGNDSTTRTQGKWEIVPYLPEHAVAN